MLGRRKPLLTGFKVTDRCNLRCRACPFWKRSLPDMPWSRVVAVLDQLYRAGVRLLILEGGEPFLWRDGPHTLEDIVAAGKERFFFTGIVTNGLLPIETAADLVWVSIDGLRESHNDNRGPTFDRVIENLEASHHPRLFANVTINSRNWREIPELVRFLAARVKGITVQFYYPYEGTQDLCLSFPQRREVLERLIALKREGYPLSDSIPVLKALRDNNWRCHPWLISSVEPDGRITFGCYLQNRADINCRQCAFAAHAEISMAYDYNPYTIATGLQVFGL